MNWLKQIEDLNDPAARVFISGPMTGVPEYNYPLFNRIAKLVEALAPKAFVYNPVREGADIWKDFAAKNKGNTTADNLPARRESQARYLDWISLHCTHMVMLPGWTRSKGARSEHSAAEAVEARMIYIPEEK